METSPTTLLICKKARHVDVGEDYVAWAVEMVKQGFDSQNLRLLAELDVPGPA